MEAEMTWRQSMGGAVASMILYVAGQAAAGEVGTIVLRVQKLHGHTGR
jgi:hypothetical protein